MILHLKQFFWATLLLAAGFQHDVFDALVFFVFEPIFTKYVTMACYDAKYNQLVNFAVTFCYLLFYSSYVKN